jgi:hypothetical protein
MKSWDVFMDAFVNVMLPDDLDPDTQEGMEVLYEKALEKYREKMRKPGEISFTWRRYEDGDKAEGRGE